MTTTVEAPVAAEPPAPLSAKRRDCPTCPPIVPGASWRDVCTCGCLRFNHEALEHKGISCGPGITCFGQNLAGTCRRPKCDCPRFRLKEKA